MRGKGAVRFLRVLLRRECLVDPTVEHTGAFWFSPECDDESVRGVDMSSVERGGRGCIRLLACLDQIVELECI